MKRIFLVDFENVHTAGLKGIKTLTENDDVILFYSEKDEDSIAFIIELRDDIQYAKIVKNGQNALDFQLSSYLGFIINKAVCEGSLDNTDFIVISKDSGYDCVISFWKKTSFIKNLKISPNIIRAENIQISLMPTETKADTTAKSVTSQQQKINEIMKKVKTFKDFHNALVKEFGTPQGGKLYQENKVKFKEKYNL